MLSVQGVWGAEYGCASVQSCTVPPQPPPYHLPARRVGNDTSPASLTAEEAAAERQRYEDERQLRAEEKAAAECEREVAAAGGSSRGAGQPKAKEQHTATEAAAQKPVAYQPSLPERKAAAEQQRGAEVEQSRVAAAQKQAADKRSWPERRAAAEQQRAANAEQSRAAAARAHAAAAARQGSGPSADRCVGVSAGVACPRRAMR